MNNERIIEKIKKLFALAASDSAQGNESENAMRMANKLLEKHSIDKLNLADNESVSCSFFTEQSKPWVKTVILCVVRLYNCDCIIDNNWSEPKFIIVGTEANRTTSLIVIQHLLDQIRKGSKGKKDDFRTGAADSLYWTCDEIVKSRKASKEEIMPGTGLVPIDLIKKSEIANADWVSANMGKTKTSRKSSARMSQEGVNYGKGLNPGARVGSAQKALS